MGFVWQKADLFGGWLFGYNYAGQYFKKSKYLFYLCNMEEIPIEELYPDMSREEIKQLLELMEYFSNE